MAWPFTNVGAPNLDSGVVPVPVGTPLVITADQCWIVGVYIRNEDPEEGATIQVFLNMTDDSVLLCPNLPGGADLVVEWPFRPSLGLKVQAPGGGSALIHVWGYK